MKSQLSMILGACWAAVALVLTARAGEIERWCANGTGPQVTERWFNAVGVPWTLCVGPGSSYSAPGYPSLGCASIAALPDASKPAMQSLYNAIQTWNNASMPPSIPNVSSFSFAAPANATSTAAFYSPGMPSSEVYIPLAWWNPYSANYNPVIQAGLDGVNTITLWDGDNSFPANMGGPQALAVTGVWANSNGTIAEADVALQVRSPVGGTQAYWSFTEDNTALNATFATKGNFSPNTPTFTDPILGYCDLQGELVHELGHLAGLGHTLVDATNVGASSTFPTMFSQAQNEPYSATISVPAPNCTFVTQSTGTDLTSLKGRLGASARTLEMDDVFAIADGYPLPAGDPYWTQTGSISGIVRNASAAPVSGVAVTAVNATQPDTIRVGTLTYFGGAYTITGLPPGSYYVKIEQVDRGTSTTSSYFLEPDVPNYVQTASNAGCVNPLPTVSAEWFDSAEGATETSNANATPVTVTAGATSTVNFVLNSLPNRLVVSLAGSIALSSPRGMRVSGGVGSYAYFYVTGIPPGGYATLFFDVQHTMTLYGSQLVEVNPVATYSAFADPSGVATFKIQITKSFARTNFLGQAMWLDTLGNPQFTNSVNLWVSDP